MTQQSVCKKKVKGQNGDLERPVRLKNGAITQRDVSVFLQLGKTLKIPVIKFLLHSASYLWFLITLLGESITMELYRDVFASRQQNILHSSFHMVWVVGGSCLSISLTLCRSTSLSHPILSVSVSLRLPLSDSLSFSWLLSHLRSLSLSLTLTLSRSRSLSLTHSLRLSLARALSLPLSLSL